MKKRFIGNLFLVLLLNLLIKPFYILGIDAEIINRVGPSVYGNYFALINFSFLLNILLDLGITNYNVKNIAQHHHLLDKYFSGIITLRLILVFIYLAVVILLALFIQYDETQIKMLIVLALNQSLVAFILYIRSNLSGLQLFAQDSIVSVLDRVILIVLCSYLLWWRPSPQNFQIEWFVYAQSLSYFITLIISFLLVFRRTFNFSFKWNLNFALVILKSSFPYALLILLMTVYYRIDSVMLERMIDDNSLQAGIYAQSYRFFEASNMFAYLFAGLLLPMFSRMIKMNEVVQGLTMLSFRILLACSFILTLFCIVYSEQIIDIRYSNYVKQSADILSILMICFIFISSTYIFGTLLTANGSLFYLNIIACFGVVLNIMLNIMLIPEYQAKGSAIASLVTQVITALMQITLCYYIFKFNFTRTFFRLFVFIVGLFCLIMITKSLNLLLVNTIMFYFLFSFLWLFISGIIKLSEFDPFLKK